MRALSEEEFAAYGPRITAFESGITYPLGADRFRIDHGTDYFAFFRRLGRLCYVVAERDGELLAMLAAVERTLDGGPAWYLGDLKLTPGGAGLSLTRRLLDVVRRAPGPDRGYGISMNPGSGNSVVRLLRRLAPDCVAGPTLSLYSLNYEAMLCAAGTIESLRGPLRYLSLHGTKDIVLTSSGAAMPLRHVQFGPQGALGPTTPEPGCAHMFCTPATGALDRALLDQRLTPIATATIVHTGMSDHDWSFVLTSDI